MQLETWTIVPPIWDPTGIFFQSYCPQYSFQAYPEMLGIFKLWQLFKKQYLKKPTNYYVKAQKKTLFENFEKENNMQL